MKKLKFIFLLNLLAIVLGITSFSVAWFSTPVAAVPLTSVAGGIVTEYFHCGSGTENDPYVITKPVHLYNLTQLYENLDGFAEANNYFQLGYDLENNGSLEFYEYDDDGIYQDDCSTSLNMNYYTAFSPIGSPDKPFKGTFDGSHLTIENLHISGTGLSDIGVFGYVSDEAEIKDLYIDNFDIDVAGAVNSDDSNHNTNAYVGYLAGHIEDAACFTNTYVNNCEIKGQSCVIKNDWGYFGKCANAESLENFIEKAKGGGTGNDWGGSIDMRSLNVRLYNHLNDTTHTTYSSKGYYGKYVNTYSNISVYRGDKASTYYKKNPTTQQVFYNLMGDGAHTKSENFTLPGTYIPLLEEADNTVSSKNTGYIVSDSQALNSANGTIRSASYQMRYIANSLVATEASDANVYSGTGSAASVSFNANNLEILTNKGTTYSSSNYYLIKDTYNQNHSVSNAAISRFTKSDATTPTSLGLVKYADSRDILDEVLTGQSFIHGIHFMGNAISTSNTISIPTAIINGETKTSYVMPKSCIDFTLKEAGYINFFGGSYYARTNSSYADSFFSLNYITRTAQGGLSTIKQINNIYANTNTAEGQPKYVYQFSDNTYSTGTRGTLLFNMSFLSNEPPAHNALYYFEIPVNEGEYALGTVSGKSGGGYLMYLDIGASGSTQEETEVDDFASIEYRTSPDTTEHSILLITYEQSSSHELEITVFYEDEKYYITTSNPQHLTVYVTILNTDYDYYYNGTPISNPTIQTYPFTT